MMGKDNTLITPHTVKVILAGDFYQLAPIQQLDPHDRTRRLPVNFAFEANTWGSVIKQEDIYILPKVYRQQNPHFVDLLERLRRGKLDADDELLLRERDVIVADTRGMGEPLGL
jgi:hypothetical protein